MNARIALFVVAGALLAGCSRGPTVNTTGAPPGTGNPTPQGTSGPKTGSDAQGVPGTGRPVTPPPM